MVSSPSSKYIPELTAAYVRPDSGPDKGKPDQSQGPKDTGPRFLRDAFCDATKNPKIAGLPTRCAGSFNPQSHPY
jgi:hypothetical protein